MSGADKCYQGENRRTVHVASESVGVPFYPGGLGKTTFSQRCSWKNKERYRFLGRVVQIEGKGKGPGAGIYCVSLQDWFLLLYRVNAFSRFSPASLLLRRKLSPLITACPSSWVAWQCKKVYHKWRDTSSQSWLSSACSDVSPKTPVSALPTLPCTLPYSLFCLAGTAERGWTKP